MEKALSLEFLRVVGSAAIASARLKPAPRKKPGDMTEFDDPFLVNAKTQPLP